MKVVTKEQPGHTPPACVPCRGTWEKGFPFIKLSSRIISDYQGKLLASGICDNTIGFYLHNIKALFRKGCREMDLELPCPFRDISIKTEKTLKRSLDPVVIKTLSAVELEKDSPLSLARDIFMFSFYTRGMSFVDIALLKKRHVFRVKSVIGVTRPTN